MGDASMSPRNANFLIDVVSSPAESSFSCPALTRSNLTSDEGFSKEGGRFAVLLELPIRYPETLLEIFTTSSWFKVGEHSAWFAASNPSSMPVRFSPLRRMLPARLVRNSFLCPSSTCSTPSLPLSLCGWESPCRGIKASKKSGIAWGSK